MSCRHTDCICSMQDSWDRLCLNTERARREGWLYGAKLVRGAYMQLERERARQKGYPSPIWDDIQQTHDNYNRCVACLILSDRPVVGKLRAFCQLMCHCPYKDQRSQMWMAMASKLQGDGDREVSQEGLPAAAFCFSSLQWCAESDLGMQTDGEGCTPCGGGESRVHGCLAQPGVHREGHKTDA